MKFLFLVDPLVTLKPYKDTSIDIMREAITRGHQVYVAEVGDVVFDQGALCVYTQHVDFHDDILEQKMWNDACGKIHSKQYTTFSNFDICFIRKDPPFDSRYLALTFLLDNFPTRPRILNAPQALRDVNEKLFALQFTQYIPSTIVSSKMEDIHAFWKEYGDIVLKPIYYGSGDGVVKVEKGAADFECKVTATLQKEPVGPILAQQFLPEVVDGDTRIMVVDGDVVGAVGRRPPAGDFRANIAAGGSEFATKLSAHQLHIASEVAKALHARGVFFAGLDMIGNHLIEANVTSPTLVQELRRVSGIDVSKIILNRLEQKLAI